MFLVWENSKSQLPCAKLILSIKMPDSGCKSLVVLQLWVQEGLDDGSGEASMGSLVSKPILFWIGTRSLTIVFPRQRRTIVVNGWHWLITSTRKSTEEDKEGKCFLCHQLPITEHSGDNIDSTTTITQCRLVRLGVKPILAMQAAGQNFNS